jgi:RsiW-degrading membrane proteinase PrsW (M82 family)
MKNLELLYTLTIPCLLTPAVHSIYPITTGKFRWEMLSGFCLLDIGLIVVTLILEAVCKCCNWRIFLTTYTSMSLLFATHVLLGEYVWPIMDSTSLASIAIHCSIFAGLVEEAVKLACWIPWIFVARRHKMDKNMLAFIAALGALIFAAHENFHMLAMIATQASDIESIVPNVSIFDTLAQVRVFLCPLLHIAFTMIGYSIWHIACAKRASWAMYIFVPVVPAFLHGLYDFLLFADIPWFKHVAPVVALITILVNVLLGTPFIH